MLTEQQIESMSQIPQSLDWIKPDSLVHCLQVYITQEHTCTYHNVHITPIATYNNLR